MSLSREFDQRLKDAMRARQERELAVLRMVKVRVNEHIRTQKIEGEPLDEDVRAIVAGYVKQLKKSLPEFEKGGEAAREAIEGIRFEIAYLEPFLPQLMDEDATRAVVAEAVEEAGHPPARMSGKVIGMVMKTHKGEVDPALVRRLVEEALAE